jgi:multidrug efflux pump subunit AcrB
MAVLEEMPEAINVDTSLKQSAGQIKITLNESELRQRNLSAGQIGGWLRTAITGSETGDITVNSEDVDLVVRLAEGDQTLSMLQNLQLPTQFGSYSLAEVADFSLETSPTAIEREGGDRVVRVTAAANNISATELLAKFQDQTQDYQIPTGYSWDVGGVNEENDKSVQSIIQAMGLSALLILITMVLQLNSFRKSLLVLSVIPLAVAGVFFNFTIMGIPLSFPALIGVLALFGIVVNNSIMLVEKINQNLKFGLPFLESVVDACASRIEAIFFTSVTTAIGLLPITISDPLWRGLGGAIIAGLSVSGTLILVLLPALFVEVFGEDK